MKNKINKYFFPIPEEDLVNRFQPIFKKITSGQSATLLSLPHTGRTSHLRFICSQPVLLRKFGVDTKKVCVSFIDIDKTDGSYSSFLLETINSVVSDNKKIKNKEIFEAVLSKDSYLLGEELIKITKKLTPTRKLIFVVTLKSKIQNIIKEIDNLFVHIQKAAPQKSVSILWSVDTKTFRVFEPGHLSTSIFDNIFYFPTFNKNETLHSVQRFAYLKGKKMTKFDLSMCYEETGGIAAYFHPYVLKLEEDNAKPNSLEKVLKSNLLNDLIKESKVSPSSYKKLTTSEARIFIVKNATSEVTLHGQVKFRFGLKAQDFLLFKMLKENLNIPVSRDQVAQTLWGKVWQTKYSDWAIDKAISRFRKNLISDEYQLLTVKNIGYQLTKI